MAKRVTKTGKDSDGDITSLCGYSWSRTKTQAISDIESARESYYVQDSRARTADVHVVHGPTGKYLRSDPNSSCSDNLDNLPNC